MKTLKKFQLTNKVKTLSPKQKDIIKGGTQNTEQEVQKNMAGHWATA